MWKRLEAASAALELAYLFLNADEDLLVRLQAAIEKAEREALSQHGSAPAWKQEEEETENHPQNGEEQKPAEDEDALKEEAAATETIKEDKDSLVEAMEEEEAGKTKSAAATGKL